MYQVQSTKIFVRSTKYNVPRCSIKYQVSNIKTLFVEIRDSYDSRISTSSFFNQRSAFDISLNFVPRISYLVFQPSSLRSPSYPIINFTAAKARTKAKR